MNAWVAKLTGKPLDRFKNPKLLNSSIPREERIDASNLNFTLFRTQPLTMLTKKKSLTQVFMLF